MPLQRRFKMLKEMDNYAFLCGPQISLRPAQSFLLNKNQVPKLQPQIQTLMPPSAQPPRSQTPPLGQVGSKTTIEEIVYLKALI